MYNPEIFILTLRPVPTIIPKYFCAFYDYAGKPVLKLLKLSLKNAWLPPIFFWDTKSTC